MMGVLLKGGILNRIMKINISFLVSGILIGNENQNIPIMFPIRFFPVIFVTMQVVVYNPNSVTHFSPNT